MTAALPLPELFLPLPPPSAYKPPTGTYSHLAKNSPLGFSTLVALQQPGLLIGNHLNALEISADVRSTCFWSRSTGQERDAENTPSLDYFNARYMASVLGRFMSADPGNAGADLSNPQSLNGYAYVGGNPLALVDPSGMDDGGGDECWDDPFCHGFPVIFGPLPSAPEPPASVTVEQSLPPGSFPGGETLGLPPGTSVPNPLSPQVLLGLWGWDCSAGVCVPGLGFDARPGWLNSVTSVFGYDQNIKLGSCLALAFKTALDDLSPFSPGTFGAAATGIQAALKYGELNYFNLAMGHAAARSLTFPNKSSIFRGLLQKSGKLAKAGEVLPLALVDVALIDGLLTEVKAMNSGQCQ